MGLPVKSMTLPSILDSRLHRAVKVRGLEPLVNFMEHERLQDGIIKMKPLATRNSSFHMCNLQVLRTQTGLSYILQSQFHQKYMPTHHIQCPQMLSGSQVYTHKKRRWKSPKSTELLEICQKPRLHRTRERQALQILQTTCRWIQQPLCAESQMGKSNIAFRNHL